MSLFTILVVLMVAGVLLWLVNTYIPMDGKIKQVLNIVAIVVIVLWLLDVFGILNEIKKVHVMNSEPAPITLVV